MIDGAKRPEVAVVTGGTAGVGRATARLFARAGAAVALLARGRERLESTRAELEAMGARVLPLSVDVADPEAVEDAARRVEEELGPIDVWVNNAMVSVFSPALAMRPEEYRRVTEVTYLGGVYGTMAALKRMRPRDRGAIVIVGSALAFRGIPLQSAYCASKHALRGFMESLRAELIHDGSRVHVCMVHLPAVNTPQFDWVKSRLPNRAQPVPPIYQPEIPAAAIYWAAHHRRREVVVGASTYKTIIGNYLLPGFLDRYLARNGFDAQQTDQPKDPGRPENLWEPAPGDYGCHGRFDDRAGSHSPLTWASLHRRALGAASLAAGALGPAAWALGKRLGYRNRWV